MTEYILSTTGVPFDEPNKFMMTRDAEGRERFYINGDETTKEIYENVLSGFEQTNTKEK